MSVNGVSIILNFMTFIVLLACTVEGSINDWLCTITLMISTVDLFLGYTYSYLHMCIVAITWMVFYTILWLTDRECQKPTQLAYAMMIVLIEAGTIGYLLH